MLTDNFCMPSEKRWVTIACPNLAGCQKADGCLPALYWMCCFGVNSIAIAPYHLMSWITSAHIQLSLSEPCNPGIS